MAVLAAGFCVAAMAGAQATTPVRTIPGTMPTWVSTITTADPSVIHFRGVSDLINSERAARKQALEVALQAWTTFCDARVMEVIQSSDELQDTDTDVLVNKVTSNSKYARVSKAAPKGLKEIDSYVEVYSVGENRSAYKVYLLMAVKTDAASAAVDKVAKEAAAVLKEEEKGKSKLVQAELDKMVEELMNSFSDEVDFELLQ